MPRLATAPSSRPLRRIVLATRASPLALIQAEIARAAFLKLSQDGKRAFESVELLKIKTTGDRQSEWPLAERGGKGLFTGELEKALLEGRADFAVHSAKDLPTTLPDGLCFAGCVERADPRDVLVRRADIEIPRIVATGSPRRRAQAQAWWPKAKWRELRGNVRTRLQKIAAGEADATFLAAAGLARLGITEFKGLIFEPVPLERMVPAAGQGAIALECRASNSQLAEAICANQHTPHVLLERAVLAALGGGCHAASGAHYDGKALHVFHAGRGYAVWDMEFPTAPRIATAKVRRWLGKKT